MWRFEKKTGQLEYKNYLPGCTPEEVIAFSVHQFGTKLGHFLFHFTHFRVESFPNAGKFRVDDAKVAMFDGDVPVFGHFFLD